MADKTQNGEWEQTCFRCYVVAESLDVDDIAERLADALIDAGFNRDEASLGAIIAVVPEKFPTDEERMVKFLTKMRSSMVILPSPEAAGDE